MTDSDTPLIPSPAPAGEWADPWTRPELFRGVTLRRILAYVVDAGIVLCISGMLWVIMLLLGVLTFGLLFPLLPLVLTLIPLIYHATLVGGAGSATWGMRLFGLQVVSVAAARNGFDGRPSMTQAIIQIVSFYGSVVMTGSLILVVALFNARRRTLHDWLSGTVVVNIPGNPTT
jgi:uncharacterized RDD family membrane protein YckC